MFDWQFNPKVKFSFTNPLNTWFVLNFESSNNNIIELSVEQIFDNNIFYFKFI